MVPAQRFASIRHDEGPVDWVVNLLGPAAGPPPDALHIDGVHQVKMANGTYNAATRACSNTGCHGTETW